MITLLEQMKATEAWDTYVVCKPEGYNVAENTPSFFITVECNIERVRGLNVVQFYLRPPLTVENLLCCGSKVAVFGARNDDEVDPRLAVVSAQRSRDLLR